MTVKKGEAFPGIKTLLLPLDHHHLNPHHPSSSSSLKPHSTPKTYILIQQQKQPLKLKNASQADPRPRLPLHHHGVLRTNHHHPRAGRASGLVPLLPDPARDQGRQRGRGARRRRQARHHHRPVRRGQLHGPAALHRAGYGFALLRRPGGQAVASWCWKVRFIFTL